MHIQYEEYHTTNTSLKQNSSKLQPYSHFARYF